MLNFVLNPLPIKFNKKTTILGLFTSLSSESIYGEYFGQKFLLSDQRCSKRCFGMGYPPKHSHIPIIIGLCYSNSHQMAPLQKDTRQTIRVFAVTSTPADLLLLFLFFVYFLWYCIRLTDCACVIQFIWNDCTDPATNLYWFTAYSCQNLASAKHVRLLTVNLTFAFFTQKFNITWTECQFSLSIAISSLCYFDVIYNISVIPYDFMPHPLEGVLVFYLVCLFICLFYVSPITHVFIS